MEFDVQTPDAGCVLDIEYDENGRPVGITVEEWMDKLDKRLIEHYGEDFRKRVNSSRRRWMDKGRWHFGMILACRLRRYFCFGL